MKNESGVTPEPGQATADADVGQESVAPDPGEARQLLTAQLAAAEDRWKRAAADLDNHRKRMGREMEAARERERQRAARALLPVVDGLDRAIEFTATADDAVLSGIGAVRQQALDALGELGYPRIEALGAPFDPRLHEVVSVTRDPTLPPGTVAAVVRAGFGSPERMLRPAGVVVTREGDKE